MDEKYCIIDTKNWKRSVHCEVFRNSALPQYCVTVELDVSDFYRKIKEKNLPFSFALIYAVTKCANEIEEFRYRFIDGNVVLYKQINTAFTYMNEETELFKVVNVKMQDCMEDYIKLALETAKNQSEYFTGPLGNDIYQFSAMPWITYLHISHTFNGNKENATPLFDWGKYYNNDGKMLLPFSVQVHHSFVDGVHIGKLVNKLQAYLNEIQPI